MDTSLDTVNYRVGGAKNEQGTIHIWVAWTDDYVVFCNWYIKRFIPRVDWYQVGHTV